MSRFTDEIINRYDEVNEENVWDMLNSNPWFANDSYDDEEEWY